MKFLVGDFPSAIPDPLHAVINDALAELATITVHAEPTLTGTIDGKLANRWVKQIDQLKLPLAEQLAAIEDDFTVLIPADCDSAVLNVSPDGKRDWFIGLASLAKFQEAIGKIADIPADLLAALQSAEANNTTVWLWRD